MSGQFRIISWYTDPEYTEIIKCTLLPSLEKLSLDHTTMVFPSQGSWKKNTDLKPRVVKSALNRYSADNIVVLDADCTINSYPELFDTIPQEYDMAVYYLQWRNWYRIPMDREELCSGTLFFRNRPICHTLVDAWMEAVKTAKEVEQQVLQNVIESMPELRVYRLPSSYCWISTLPDGRKPHMVRPESVVIEHYQASRKMRYRG